EARRVEELGKSRGGGPRGVLGLAEPLDADGGETQGPGVEAKRAVRHERPAGPGGEEAEKEGAGPQAADSAGRRPEREPDLAEARAANGINEPITLEPRRDREPYDRDREQTDHINRCHTTGER